jgi:hypothetical protein
MKKTWQTSGHNDDGKEVDDDKDNKVGLEILLGAV